MNHCRQCIIILIIHIAMIFYCQGIQAFAGYFSSILLHLQGYMPFKPPGFMKNIVTWVAQLFAALYMLYTVIAFKFPGAIDSIHIFSKIGMEPHGRIGSGVVELIASVLLLIPKYSWVGAFLGLGTMSGAIFFHLTSLGIEVKGDGGALFATAITIWVCCLLVLILRKKHIPIKL